MAALTWAFDWGSTPLGPVADWPGSLKTSVGMLLQSNHPMFLWWGPELIQFYNDAYRKTMGPERHPSALGQPGRECWQEIWPIIGPQIERVLAGGPATWQEEQLVPVTRHGSRQDVWWTYGYSAIPGNDGVAGVLVVCTDVTSEHLARQQLLQLNERLATEVKQRCFENERQKRMFQQAPGFMCILRGPEHVFEFANDAYTRLVGARRVVGKPIREALPEAEGQGFVDLLDRVYNSGEPFVATGQPIQLQHTPQSPVTQRILDFLYQPLIEADGSVSGIFVQGEDVTERKGAERDLHEADRRKDEFLAMLAHELRNPLAPISAAAHLLQATGHDEEKVRQASEIISRQVSHMTSLVDDLLDVSRVSRGQVRLDRKPIAVEALLREATEQVRPLIESCQHRLDTRLPSESAYVFGDRKRLVQVLANLLNNAAKYTPLGGDLAVEVDVAAGEDAVKFVVRDNGIGIEPQLLPHVFELFTQASRAIDRSQGGLGIGLSLVKGIAELHGGSVSAHSAGSGTGAEFVLTLPRHHAPEASLLTHDRVAGTASPPAESLRILIVDDNPDATRALAMCMEAAGHEVSTAPDAMTALQTAASAPADVYLLDIGLPGMDGNELARRIRAAGNDSRPMLIAITGYGEEASRNKSMEAGFDHYFVKPVDPRALITLLSR